MRQHVRVSTEQSEDINTHVPYRGLTASHRLLLSGHVGIPVANQTVILHAVALMANKPICIHFAFALTGE